MGGDRKTSLDTPDEDVIKLFDEDGTEHEFSVVDVLEVDDRRYAVLQPVVDGEESDTAVIFRMEDDTLVTIEDDAEFERVRQVFESEDDESTTESGESGPEVRSKSDSETSH